MAEARSRGVHVVLVTGRRLPAARRVAVEVGPDLPLVLHNGALMVLGGVTIGCTPLPREVAARAITFGRRHAADAVIHAGQRGEGRLLIEAISPHNPLLSHYLERSRDEVVQVADLLAVLDEDPLEVMFGGECQALARLAPLLAAELGGCARVERTLYPERGVAILDVLHPAVGKGVALARLCEHFGVPREQSLAVGDNWNDLDMLEWAGLGLLMGNADPQLRARGLPVLPTHDEDGAAVAIERYILCPVVGDPNP